VCAGELAHLLEQVADLRAVGRHVESGQVCGAAVGERLRARACLLDGGGMRSGRGQGRRLGEVPEDLVQLPHDRQDGEHLPRQLGELAPAAAAEGALGDVLARAEAVEHAAAGEAALAEPVVDAAPEVRLEVRAGDAGGLVDREVGRGGERGGDAAQTGAVRAVRTEVGAAIDQGQHDRSRLGRSRTVTTHASVPIR
jgi:hypothetical protein